MLRLCHWGKGMRAGKQSKTEDDGRSVLTQTLTVTLTLILTLTLTLALGIVLQLARRNADPSTESNAYRNAKFIADLPGVVYYIPQRKRLLTLPINP